MVIDCETLPELVAWVQSLENMPAGVSLTRRESGSMERKLLWCNQAYAAFSGRTAEELLSAGDMRGFQARIHCPAQSRRLQRSVEIGRAYKGRYFWLKHHGLHLAMHYTSWPTRTNEGIFVVGFDLPLPHQEADPEFPGLRLNKEIDGWFMN